MKKLVLVILVLATAGLAAVCVVEFQKVTRQQAQVAQQRAALEETNKALAALQQAQEHNEQRQRELLQRSDELVAQAKAQAALSNQLALKRAAAAAADKAAAAEKDPSGLGSMLGKMMQDPDTKNLIRQTQRMMMDQLYGPLIKQLNLSPEEAEKFKDILADNGLKAAEQASSMFGAPGATNRTELASRMEETQKNLNDQMKALLGDSRYQQYEEYQKTAAERMQLNTFKQQLGSDHPLSDQQTDQLLALMHEEQLKVATATGQPLPGSGNKAAEFDMMMSDEKLQAFLDNEAQAYQSMYNRARDFLTPDQLEAFGTFQTNQLQMVRMGITMARKMFGSQAQAQPASGQ